MGMHSTYTATHYKDLNIDWQARAVTRHGEDILLTPQEFALLQVLFDHRGQAVSRGDLLHTAWGYPCIGITRTVAPGAASATVRSSIGKVIVSPSGFSKR